MVDDAARMLCVRSVEIGEMHWDCGAGRASQKYTLVPNIGP